MLQSPNTAEALLQASLTQDKCLKQIFDTNEINGFNGNLPTTQYAMLPQQSQPAPRSQTGMATPSVVPLNNTDILAFQDSPGQLWSANILMSHVNTPMDPMAELQLVQSVTANSSLLTTDGCNVRCESTTSNQDRAELRESVRIEVGHPRSGEPNLTIRQANNSQRRKGQNRAAQRAYRERKEKALCQLRELLDQKEKQFQALQKDHEDLQDRYEKLLASREQTDSLSITLTYDQNDPLFQT